MTQSKKKFVFPTAYTVIIIVLILVQLLTFFIPAGNYPTLAYDKKIKLISQLALAAGPQGMVSGQTDDILGEYKG